MRKRKQNLQPKKKNSRTKRFKRVVSSVSIRWKGDNDDEWIEKGQKQENNCVFKKIKIQRVMHEHLIKWKENHDDECIQESQLNELAMVEVEEFKADMQKGGCIFRSTSK